MSQPDTQRPTTEDRQQAIAKAARALIAERGFEGLRTRDIAERVGINIATLHYHVPTKQALVRLVAQSLREDFTGQSLRRPREGLSPRAQLELEFADFRDLLYGEGDILAVMAELSSRAKRDPEVEAEIAPMNAHWHADFASILERGRADGSFRSDLDPVAGATLVIGALIGTARFQTLSQDHFGAVRAELLRALGATNEADTHE